MGKEKIIYWGRRMIEVVECKGTVDAVAIKEFLKAENKEAVIRKYENYAVATILEHSYNLSKMVSKLNSEVEQVAKGTDNNITVVVKEKTENTKYGTRTFCELNNK